ncbi:unnamed protein product [Symbiodinium microadriaticum]|nr:unnamed protein product [Symbiodinium microadriaticum]
MGSNMTLLAGTTGIPMGRGIGGRRVAEELMEARGITHGSRSGGPLLGKEHSDSNRRQSMSTMDEETWAGEATGSVDEGSRDEPASSRGASAKSGKDFIPEYDGTAPMREYQRRVNLFEISTSIDPSFRAQKLMEKLTGTAWLATESIPLETLKHPEGVKRLMDHLWKELEPLEFLRTFQTLADFYKGFRRARGQEFVAYDMEFRRHNQRLEEISAGLSGVTKAYWFLEKAGLSSELRKQVVAAVGGQYDYAKLRSAVMAIVPQVHREDETTQSSAPANNRQWRKASAKVHATVEEDDEGREEIQDAEEGSASPEVEMLEEELQCLMTQAAKKRAQVERARGYGAAGAGKGSRQETPEARQRRIAELKQKMPCSACKAHGKTVYGHWHSDPECPYGGAKKPFKSSGEKVLAVVEEDESSDSDHLAPGPVDIFMATENWCASAVSGEREVEENKLLALSDTCCARSVAGEKWAQAHMKHLHQQAVDVYIVDEDRPFRFGAGPRVSSSYSMVFPVCVPGATTTPWIRVSIVSEDVPLLLSKGALKAMGARLDLESSKIELTRLGAIAPLVETSSGLCGFVINEGRAPDGNGTGFPPVNMLEGEAEIGLAADGTPAEAHVHVAVKDDEEDCEQMAERLLRQGEFSYESLEGLAQKLPIIKDKQRGINRKARKQIQGITAGLWAHGNMQGVTKNTQRFPNTVRYLNSFVKSKCDGTWTSLVLLRDVRMTLHKDCHNAEDSTSLISSFGSFGGRGGELWVAGPGEDADQVAKIRVDPSGRRIEGHLVDTFQKPYQLNPKTQHATQPWTGVRWCMSCYTSRAHENLDMNEQKTLLDLGFPLPNPKLFSKVSGLTVMADKFTAPKRKEEYVQAILARSTIDVTNLRKLDVERLKQIWTMVKPRKPASPLPVGWKKLDVAGLKEIYDKVVRTDLEREDDGHWQRWHRPQLVTEIDLWLAQVQEESKDAPEDLFHENPLCSRCAIPMVVRTNRVTKTDFFGCLMFPVCTETLPLKYAGMPTKHVQESISPKIAPKKKDLLEVKSGKGYGTKGLSAHKRRDKNFADEPGVSSDGSWLPTGSIPIEEAEDEADRLYNANVPAEEMKMLHELRKTKQGGTD